MSSRSRRQIAWIAGSIVLLVALIGAVSRLGAPLAPESDYALLDGQILQTLRGWQPVGAYSRFGGHHPGPLYFQLLAPFYWASGYRHVSVELAIVSLNVLCIAGAMVVLLRHSRSATLPIVASILLGVFLARMDQLLVSPWNPHAPILALGLLVVCSAAVVSGSSGLVPLCALLASFCVQTHMGLGPAAAAALFVAGVAAIARALRSTVPGQRSQARRSLAVAAVVAVLVWSVPLIDELRPAGLHNLRQIASFFGNSQPYSPRRAAHAFEHLIVSPFTPGLALEWGKIPLPASEPLVRGLAVGLFIAVVAAMAVAFRRGRTFESALAATCVIVGAVSYVAVRRLPEEVHDYTIVWLTVLGVLSWASALSEGIDAPAGFFVAKTSRLATGFAVALALVTIVLAVRQFQSRYGDELRASRRILALTAIVRNALPAGGTTPRILVPPDFWGVATGVVLELYRSGLHPTVEQERVSMFGTAFAPDGVPDLTVAFAREDEHVNDYGHRANYRGLGRADDVWAYRVSDPPTAVLSNERAQFVEASALISGAARLLDGQLDGPSADLASGRVVFADVEEFMTVRPPAGAIGIRLWGAPGTTWQFRCDGANRDFQRIGRSRVGDETPVGVVDAFPTDLPGCSTIKIAPASVQSPIWLTEIGFLVSAGR